MSGSVDLAIENETATLALNNPDKRNAISAEMWEDLAFRAEEISRDTRIRAVIVRGSGNAAFAAGADISQFESKRTASERGSSYDSVTEKAIEAVQGINAPVIALIHGFCIGGAVSLALACDLRFSSDDASFAIPAARLGIAYPSEAVERLVRLIGPSSSKYLLFSARRISAPEAKEIGLVDRVVKKDDLDDEVLGFVDTLKSNAPLSIAASKTIVNQVGLEPSLREQEKIDAAARSCFESEDYKEGVRAFLESRTAQFKGS